MNHTVKLWLSLISFWSIFHISGIVIFMFCTATLGSMVSFKNNTPKYTMLSTSYNKSYLFYAALHCKKSSETSCFWELNQLLFYMISWWTFSHFLPQYKLKILSKALIHNQLTHSIYSPLTKKTDSNHPTPKKIETLQ